jgi:transglutaminase/protease-like cytokinesis protein 3
MNYKRDYPRNKRQKTPSYFSRKQSNQIPILLIALIIISAWIAIKNQASQSITDLQLFNSPTNLISNSNNNRIYSPITPGKSPQIRGGNYQAIDRAGRNVNYAGYSVSELALALSKYAKTEAEKARIIYIWITDNIDYNVAGFLTGNYGDATPTGVLKNRLAVCAGYANLYQALAQKMGLQSAVIVGDAKGLGYIVGDSDNIGHAWNGVKINNAWYLIDVTWGAGTINNNQFQREFNSHYFATPPTQMIYSHFPEQSFWQLLPKAYTKQQFNSWPIVTAQFFRDGIKLVNHKSYTIQSMGITEVILQVPYNTQISAQLQQNNLPINSHLPLVQSANGQTKIKVSFPNTGTYDLLIFSKKKSDKNNFRHALSYRITANASGVAIPKTYSIFTENNAYLHSPTIAKLNKNQFVNFKIEVSNALAVVVIDQSSGNWTPLSKSGNLFFGNVKVGSGKITIAGKFAEDNRYSSLVEYE